MSPLRPDHICKTCPPRFPGDSGHPCYCIPSVVDRADVLIDGKHAAARPPENPCRWCGAASGQACRVTSTRNDRTPQRLTHTPGGCHPSRVGVAA